MVAPVLLSLGSINVDFQVRIDEPIKAGRTLLARDFVRLSGGKAANVAFLARRLGLQAQLFGRVGDDELAEQALSSLRSIGVDLGHVSVAKGSSTAVSMIAVPPDGKKSIVLASNANDDWDEESVKELIAVIEHAPNSTILVADYEIPPRVVTRAIEAACARNLPVVIDPSPADRVDRTTLSRVIAITPNPKEAEALTGVAVDSTETAAEAACRLSVMGVSIVCVKLPDGGCVLAHESRLILIPPGEVRLVDSTGAGDAFAGALAVALAEKYSPLEAACFAVAASSLSVTTYGSQPSYPSREEVNTLLPSVAENVHSIERHA